MARRPRALGGAYSTEVTFDPTVADGYMKHYVPIPVALSAAWDAAGVKRVRGTLDGVPFRRAVSRRANGEPCLRFGAGWLADAGFEIGQRVQVDVAPDDDPERVDVPPVLARLFGFEPELEAIWHGLTPGRRRTLVYPVARAKRPETQLRKAEALLDALRRGETPGPPRRRRHR